jgi:hypothetical protein
MSSKEELERLCIGELEALPSGRFQYSIRNARSGTELGTVRICDDHRLETTSLTGGFTGVHRTLAEAMEALSSGVVNGFTPSSPAASDSVPAPEHQEPASSARMRPIRRGVYVDLASRRRAAP